MVEVEEEDTQRQKARWQREEASGALDRSGSSRMDPREEFSWRGSRVMQPSSRAGREAERCQNQPRVSTKGIQGIDPLEEVSWQGSKVMQPSS